MLSVPDLDEIIEADVFADDRAGENEAHGPLTLKLVPNCIYKRLRDVHLPYLLFPKKISSF